MVLTPSQRLERLRLVQRQAADTAQDEQARLQAERADPRHKHDLEMTRQLVLRLRLREFRNLTTAVDIDELNWLARDYEDENNGDWTR